MELLHDTFRGSRLEPAGSAERRVRLGGALLLAGSLCAVPATLALEPVPPVAEYAIPGSGVAAGLLLLLAPAAWLSAAWIHGAIVVATALIAAGVAAMSDDYAFFYVVVAIYAAYAIDEGRWHLAYTALLIATLFLPLSYTDTFTQALHQVLVTLPVLVISMLIVIDLRRAIAARERAYRGFAAEAIQLTTRIRRTSTLSSDGEEG